jgi:RNA polymerase sigma factor (sigma-70 family)
MRLKPFRLHPLRAIRQPGPRPANAPSPGEEDLHNASKVLKLVDSGELSKTGPENPISVPCGPSGRPLKALTAAQEQELARRIQENGDIDARNVLVLANLGLVHLLAKQQRHREFRYEDLVQEGVLGLLRATETFDPNRGIRFSTYCVYWIRARIQRLGQKLDRDDLPPIHGVNSNSEEYPNQKPRAHKISLQMTVDGDGTDREFGESVPGTLKSPEENLMLSERSGAVKAALLSISQELADKRLLLIIHQRLLSDNPQTLTVIGEKLNLSREGARLLERKVLRMARQRLAPYQKSA